MKVRLKDSLRDAKVYLVDTAARAEKRRLNVYRGRISCRPACSGCCSRLIRISMAEAVLIYEHLSETGRWTEVRRTCVGQMKLLGPVDPMVWFKMNQKCPVLDRKTDMCTAYSVRPATCATHFVTSDPELCDPWSAKGGKYETADFSDLFETFRRRLSASIRDYGIFTMVLPMPSALMLAEQISVKSGLSLAEVVSLFFQEL